MHAGLPGEHVRAILTAAGWCGEIHTQLPYPFEPAGRFVDGLGAVAWTVLLVDAAQWNLGPAGDVTGAILLVAVGVLSSLLVVVVDERSG